MTARRATNGSAARSPAATSRSPTAVRLVTACHGLVPRRARGCSTSGGAGCRGAAKSRGGRCWQGRRRRGVLVAFGGEKALAREFPRTPRLQSNPFTLGVASGDPLPDGVVLWTRLAPEPLTADGGLGAHVDVQTTRCMCSHFWHVA
jgi:PhoD-like phosphatase, N-terminal domain